MVDGAQLHGNGRASMSGIMGSILLYPVRTIIFPVKKSEKILDKVYSKTTTGRTSHANVRLVDQPSIEKNRYYEQGRPVLR